MYTSIRVVWLYRYVQEGRSSALLSSAAGAWACVVYSMHFTSELLRSALNKDFLEDGLRRLAELAASSVWRAGPKVGPEVGKQPLKWADGVRAAAALGAG
jgi:hypothetical protein